MCEVAPVRKYKSLHLTRAGKSEQPLLVLVTADQLEETAKPYQDKAEPFFCVEDHHGNNIVKADSTEKKT